MVTINISYGELADRLTILRLKKEMILDPEKRHWIDQELPVLERKWDNALKDAQIKTTDENLEAAKKEIIKLGWINKNLWQIEDQVREYEKLGEFGVPFIHLARQVYQTNDKRYESKQKIDKLLNSFIREQKSYNQ